MGFASIPRLVAWSYRKRSRPTDRLHTRYHRLKIHRERDYAAFPEADFGEITNRLPVIFDILRLKRIVAHTLLEDIALLETAIGFPPTLHIKVKLQFDKQPDVIFFRIYVTPNRLSRIMLPQKREEISHLMLLLVGIFIRQRALKCTRSDAISPIVHIVKGREIAANDPLCIIKFLDMERERVMLKRGGACHQTNTSSTYFR